MNGIASIADFRDDSALVHAALAGDLSAKEALYRRYVDMACSLTVRLICEYAGSSSPPRNVAPM